MTQPPGFRIVIIDDDPLSLELTSRRLRRAGYEVAGAASWGEARPELDRGAALAFVDVNLGSFDGSRLAQIIKETYKETRVVLFSADDPSRLEELAAGSGADGFISKSTPWEGILEFIEKLLRGGNKTTE